MNVGTGYNLVWDALPVYFMHIPKTGGIALGNWLRSAYGNGYFDLDLPQIVHFKGQDIRTFRCYHAWHHGKSMYDWLGRSDLAVITLLRDPIERVVSGFNHWQRMLGRNPPQVKAAYRTRMRHIPDQTIQDCLDEELLVEILSNEQVKYLGARKDYDAVLSSPSRNWDGDDLLLPYDVPSGPEENDVYLMRSNACAWLDHMAVVGLTERYTESLLMFGDLLGVPVPTSVPRANVNPQRTHAAMRYQEYLPSGAIKRLTELNQYDLDLYGYAQDIFEQEWSRYQRRSTRTVSLAPRLRIPLHSAKIIVRNQIRRRWPGLMELRRRWKNRCRMDNLPRKPWWTQNR